MPVLKIQTNAGITQAQRNDLLTATSAEVARILGKPETYVMVILECNPDMIFGASQSALAYLELKSIGLPADRTGDISGALCKLINQQLAIPLERIYIEFANAERHMWGWNGGTF